jgi:hypothetical protein
MAEVRFVDLGEAIRSLVRRLPGCDALADEMTDHWIRNVGDAIPRSEEAKRRGRAYGKAADILEDILPSGKVHGFGVSAAAPAAGQRPIEIIEWASASARNKLRVLNVRQGRLEPRQGVSFEQFPAILNIYVSIEDLERESAEAIERLRREANLAPSLKAVLREKIDREGRMLTQVEAEKIARARGAIETRKEIRRVLKTLGGSTKRGPKGPRTKCAEPAA